MKTIEIAKDMQASVLSLGCMRIADHSAGDLEKLINTALDLGINHFDHADIYGGGKCETVFGNLLRDKPSMRDKMLIQSKCGIGKGQYDFSKEHILSSVDASLKRLNTDHLDTLLLHRPDALMEPEEVAQAFNILEESGKVRYFGVSNFNTLQFQLMQSALKQKIIANQLQLSIMHTGLIDFGINTNTKFDGGIDRDGSILDYCRLKDVTVQAWSPFQYGFFEGVFVDNEKFPKLNEKLAEAAESHGVSKSAIAAAWILRHPSKMQVVLGTTNPDRLTDISGGADICLTRSQWYEIYLAAGNTLP